MRGRYRHKPSYGSRATSYYNSGSRKPHNYRGQSGINGIGRLPTVLEDCAIFLRTGRCDHIKTCKYQHIPEHKALCQAFFMTGRCSSAGGGGRCMLSHRGRPENTPMCVHFARGKCTKEDCHFSHMTNLGDHPLDAPVCRNFALNGWCSNGATCTRKHCFECPEFESTGSCSNPRCRLQHTIVASSNSSASKSNTTLTAKNTVKEAAVPSIANGESIDVQKFIDLLEKLNKADVDKLLYDTTQRELTRPEIDKGSNSGEGSDASSEDSDSSSETSASDEEFDNDAEFVAF